MRLESVGPPDTRDRSLRDTASLSIVRVDHCVALSGVFCVVLAINPAVISAVIVAVRPGHGASSSRPSTPIYGKRPRHKAIMRGATLRLDAICMF